MTDRGQVRRAAVLAMLGLVAGLLSALGAQSPATAGANEAGPAADRTAAASIALGSAHTCALLTTGAVRCWGNGASGRLGHNNTDTIGDGVGDSIAEAGDVPLGGTAVAISAGSFHTCALLGTGAVRCWGSGANGKLGHDSTANIGDHPARTIAAAGDVPLGGTATAITAGSTHTCALLDTGAVRCWGSGANGRLGHDSTANIGDHPARTITAAGDVPLGGTATSISAGEHHTCALLSTGAVRCWGSNPYGQLGHGHTDNIGDGVEGLEPLQGQALQVHDDSSRQV